MSGNVCRALLRDSDCLLPPDAFSRKPFRATDCYLDISLPRFISNVQSLL